jgi:hypothetical protein
MQEKLPDVSKALLILSSFAKRNPNVDCGFTPEELDELSRISFEVYKELKKPTE